MSYKKVKVMPTMFGKVETNCKFNTPTISKRYVKILALCLTYAPAKLIYQGVKNPIMKQVRDMCRAGLLERYSRPRDRKYYYKTTPAGRRLLTKVVNS